MTTPAKWAQSTGLTERHLFEFVKKCCTSHDIRSVLRGEERIGPALMLLFIPDPDSKTGEGLFALLSIKEEYQRKPESPGRIQ